MSDLVAAPVSIQKKCVKEVFSTLEESPDTQRGKKTKKLKGYANLWRYALTDPEYRIIYEVDKGNRSVKLLMMGPRKDNKIYNRMNYVPGQGPSKIAMEVIPDIEPQFIASNPEVLQIDTPEVSKNISEALPPLDENQLKKWRVDTPHWAEILKCQTEEELLNANIPQHVKLRVMDCLWPSAIEQVISQPTYVVEAVEDLGKIRDGLLSRLLLNLDKEQSHAIAKSSKWPMLIKGGPGTGKSIVALYKAAQLIKGDGQQGELYDPPRVLFTTYTKSLIHASKQLFEAYLGKEWMPHLEVINLDRLANQICREARYPLNIINDKDINKVIQRIITYKEVGDLEGLPRNIDSHYLKEEFSWVIEGWGLKSEQEYLSIARPGRKIALNERQRKVVWSIYQRYRLMLVKLKKNTFENAQVRALDYINKLEKQNTNNRLFDYVFIDEAQDLKPVGLRLCAALCRNEKNIYLTADMNQAIYGKGVSWNSVVESLRFTGNRTTTLKKNYRSTDQILRGADDLIQGLDGIDSDTAISEPVRTGQRPEFRLFPSKSQQVDEIANWLKSTLRALRLPLGCAVVLCPTGREVKELTVSLEGAGVPSVEYSDGGELDTPRVKVMKIHGAKGLEFPVVVIPNFSASAFSWLEPKDPDAQLVAARKLYFVACTRAMKKLLVCAVGERKDSLHKLISSENWEM